MFGYFRSFFKFIAIKILFCLDERSTYPTRRSKQNQESEPAEKADDEDNEDVEGE